MMYLFMTALIIFSLLPMSANANVVAFASCQGIKLGQQINWDGAPMSTGQIGKLSILKDTSLYHFVDGNPIQEKLLPHGNTYRIYTFKKDYLGVGGGYYVKRDDLISYKTPSKQKLQDLACSNGTSKGDEDQGNGVPTTPTIPAVQPKDLGPQVFNLSTMASKAGMDQNGNAYLYVILHGTPASLAVVDLNTNLVRGVYPLQNSTSAWALDVDRDGILWVGGTTRGELYSYNPNTDQLKDFGDMMENQSDTSIQDLTVNDQYVYGSTAYGANVFVFNKKTEKKERTLSTVVGKSYAKSLVVDPNNQYLYVSSGPTEDLLIWDLNNNFKVTLPTENYASESYVEKMKLIDNYLAVKFYPSHKGNIYSFSTGAFLNEFDVDSRGFSPKDEQTNEFYYTYQGNFYGYDLNNGTSRNTNASLPGKANALSLDFINLKEDPSQTILTGLIDNNGTYYLYNPVTNQLKIKKASFPSQPVNLYSIFSDPDKKYIYVNGYMTGGLTQYDTVKKKSIQLSGINQLESAIFVNGKIYAGGYPRARLLEVSPNEPWNQTSVKELISLDKLGQERIPALTSYNNHIFAGTYPQTSTKGGLLLDYDLTTNQYKANEDYIPNQSIITLLPDDTKIYGGSSIHANYQKANDGAKFFRFDPQNPSEKELIPLPIVNASLVMSLIKGPDGNIWGAADGTIFSYDPVNNSFRTVKMLNGISGRFGNAKLLVGKDGFIYGTIEGRLFKLNPADMSYKNLLESGAYNVEQDAQGNLYYKNLANFYMYPVK
jgi:WD40 repeat protein